MPRSIHDKNFNKVEPGDFIVYDTGELFLELEEVTEIVFDDPEDGNRCAIYTTKCSPFVLEWRWNPCIARDFKVIKIGHQG